MLDQICKTVWEVYIRMPLVIKIKILERNNLYWDRSFSEPDLTDPFKHLSRFTIKHPHEYISVDDLKFFRRKKPPDLHTRSNICLHQSDEPVLPFSSLKTEYRRQFRNLGFSLRPSLLRRSTSLHLEGLMHHLSEQRDKFHWFTPEDWQFSRSYPIKNPENLCLAGDISMEPEYRSSYISYPMVDRTAMILPREAFRIEPDPTDYRTTTERSPEEVAAINKLAEDKFKRDIAAQEQQKCHLQIRAAETKYNTTPSEYKRQYVQFPIEKAHSIPQISHIKMQGAFTGVPEYQDSFKMYANYSKSAPIKKLDNLRRSGAEELTNTVDSAELPEYREKFRDPPKNVSKEKSLKTDDHLHPRGKFSKDVPEYYESFRDPQVKQMPERGKCREPYLRLKGKIEFNPEYRNTYLDFPRSRPIVRKPASCFRLPNSSTASTTADSKSPQRTPRRKFKSSSPKRYEPGAQLDADISNTPEYRRAQYNYQLRERTPTRKIIESDGGGNAKTVSIAPNRRSSDSSTDAAGKSTQPHKRRPARNRQTAISHAQDSFENVGSYATKKPTKFGRRASVLQNTVNLDKDTNFTTSSRQEADDSFVVLNEPCKRSNWMKKSWYES